MTVQTFTWRPSRATLQRKPRVKTARFGDGYEQRATDGLNANLDRWELAWSGLLPNVAADIDAFLSARGGAEAFYYTTKLGRQILCVCREWSLSDGDTQSVDIVATFEEVPEIQAGAGGGQG